MEQERCNGDMRSTSVIKNSRVSNPAIFSKNFASGSILSISKNYLTQFILHSRYFLIQMLTSCRHCIVLAEPKLAFFLIS